MKKFLANIKAEIMVVVVVSALVCASCSDNKEMAKLEQKLELKSNFENNLVDSVYVYSTALIVFNEEDVTGLGHSIGKDKFLTGYGCCQRPANNEDPMGSQWEYCNQNTEYSANGKLRLVAWNTQRFLLPDVVRDLKEELPTHKFSALLDYCHDRIPGAYKPIVEVINEGVADTIVARKMCELSGTNMDVYKTNKKRCWMRGAVYCGKITIQELMNVQMAVQNNIQDLSVLYYDEKHTHPKYDSATVAFVLGNSYGTAKGTLGDELAKSTLGRSMIDYIANGSDVVPDFNSNIVEYGTYPVLDWRILNKYGGVQTYVDLAKLYYKKGRHDDLINLAMDIFSQKVDGKQYWEKDSTMLQFAWIKYYVGMSYYKNKKNYETAAAKLIDGLNINKQAETFDRELTVKIYCALGDCRKKLGGDKKPNYAEAKRIEEGGDIDRALAAAPVAAPIRSAIIPTVINSKWVFRADCVDDGYGYGNPAVRRLSHGVLRPHFGVDFGLGNGKPVISRVKGKIVAKCGTDGNKVVIKLEGKIHCAYLYTKKSKPVGTAVSVGDTIAWCAYSAFYSEHPEEVSHVHFEVREIIGGNYSDFGKYNRDYLQRSRVLNPYPYILGDSLKTRMPKEYQACIQKIFDDYAAGIRGATQQITDLQRKYIK